MIPINQFRSTLVLASVLIAAIASAQTDSRPRLADIADNTAKIGNGPAKAGGDTINLLGSHGDPTNEPGEPYFFGDFQDAEGNPAWNGWTSVDLTAPTVSHWNVSTYNQPDPENYAAWCGDIDVPSCTEQDPVGGYGDRWHDMIEFRQAVPFPESSSTITITATLIHDTEPGYDYVHLSYRHQGQQLDNAGSWDGAGTVAVSETIVFLPLEYLDSTDIAVYFRFISDGAWSDEDCKVQTAGACQIDDINVHLVNGDFTGDFFEDFEHDGDPADLGIWSIAYPDGVGDFAQILADLEDNDPCRSNSSPQVAFIDDGLIVPGTGGSECINWCYGPGGYIVTTTGGLTGPSTYINNAVESPVMPWPDPKTPGAPDYDGVTFNFSLYMHEDLSSDAPGVFATWGVRSADTDGSAGNGVQDISTQPWRNFGYVYYGFPAYYRGSFDVTGLMNPGRDVIQIGVSVIELGYVWGYNGNDGYPAPYFDDIGLKIFPYLGPGMGGGGTAQDGFPARGTIDMGDLGSHSVRFDSRYNIAPEDHLRNDPGDSLTIKVVPVRAGSGLTGNPTMHYSLNRNPVFDPFRTSGLADTGVVIGEPAVGFGGITTPDVYAFDLPDTGFFFPGDEIHYFYSATDAIGGPGGIDPQTALAPEDTTGFSTGFGDFAGFPSRYTVRALPSIIEDGAGGHTNPGILFINDAGSASNRYWATALGNIGLVEAEDYDVYYDQGGGSASIGGRSNHLMLDSYDDLLYTSGGAYVFTISNGDHSLAQSDDVGTLMDWIDHGGKDIFLTGDGLASDLAQSGAATNEFLESYMGISVLSTDIRPLIGNQTTPLIRPVAGNPVWAGDGNLQGWIAYGGCFAINTFDAVNVFDTGRRLAEFLDPAGTANQYSYSAATLNIRNPGLDQSRIISMPVGLKFVMTDPAADGDLLAARSRLLKDVLMYFGQVGDPLEVSDAPDRIAFEARNFPNPFNPATTISYSMPRAGHLKLSIYDVRGRLVRTLIDAVKPMGADQTMVWDGADNRGQSVSSGLYFYEAKTGDEVRIGKMTLVK